MASDHTHTHHTQKQPAYRLEFHKSGTNSSGATVGKLYLFRDGIKVEESDVFSGGADPEKKEFHRPIGDGDYTIRLKERSTLTVNGLQAGKDFAERYSHPDLPDILKLIPHGGLQFIPQGLMDTPYGKTNPRREWGGIRIHLHQPAHEHRQDHMGNYLHGKERETGGNWTHGCICERREKILDILSRLPKGQHDIPVQVRGGRLSHLPPY